MKALLLISLTVLTSHIAHAADSQTAAESWTCYAQGSQGVGGPIGEIWMTVSGHGSTEFEATSQAQQNCYSQGLQRCMVRDCFQDQN
jgi:hypothetical protein